MEACYVNTGHPDFISGHRAMALVSNKLEASKAQSVLPSEQKGKIPASAINNNKDLDVDLKTKDEGFFGSFWSAAGKVTGTGTVSKKPKGGIVEAPPAILKASGTLSEREQMETEVIK
jgi:vacuolar protein sorting-associated protein 1